MATDYTTGCSAVPLSFIQMLASTIFGYHDLAGLLHYRLNALEYTDECAALSDSLDCNTTHIEPERQLVERIFALDDCSLLATKIFSNTDSAWSDYSNCTEMPQTFIQMLARCIVTYGGITKLNSIIASGACTEVTQLLACPNDIEAERLLVANLFGTDSCGRLFIKLFENSSTMTDYNTACEQMPQSFYQMLARCIVLYDGHYYLNIASVSGYCDDLHAFWTCSNNHIDPERALVENVFATDECDILALKIFNNQGEARQ